MAEKISVQIELDGGKEVERQLADIGAAGEKSFAQIGKAGEQANDGIAKTGEVTEKAAESTSKLTLANAALVASIAKSTAGFALHGVEIVQAVRHHETLLQSLLKLASGANTAVKAFSLIAPQLTLVGAGALAIAGPIAAAVTAFEALEKVATKFAGSNEKLNHTLQTLAATSGESFQKLQVGEAAFEQIGIAAETFRGSIAKINETLAGTEVTNLTKGMKDVVELVKQIAAGDKTITFADWVTAEDKIKGVSIAMKQAADAGKNATQVLLEFLRSADLATALKVGAAFGLSDADVDRVRRFSGSINDLIQRIQGAGPLLSPEAAAAFDRMRTSIQNADSAWVRFKQSLVSVDVSAMAASISATMNDIKATVFNAAASISERMGQAFRAMGQEAGRDIADIKAALAQLGVTNFFRQMGIDAQNAVTGANAAIAAFVGGVMRGMGASEEAIKRVQDQINGLAQAAGQAAQSFSGTQFTVFGTLAQEGTNTAKKGAEEATIQFTTFGTVAGKAGAQGKAAGETAASGWDLVSTAIKTAYEWLLKFIGLEPSAPATGSGASGKARGGMIGGRGSGTSDSNLAWLSRGEFVVQAAAVRKYGAGLFAALNAQRFAGGGLVGGGGTSTIQGSGIEGIVKAIEENSNAIASQSEVIGKLGQMIENMGRAVSDLVFTVGGLAQQQAELVKSISAAWQAKGQARGGLLGGRGSGTSDSNLAWLSRGEYITPARAVGQPGVLAFLEALRRSGGNLRGVLDGMGRFALGGMVPRMPAFAGGGAVGSMSHVTIAFPGLPPIGGLRASSAVVDELQRAAALAQVRSGGRKPSRYS